METLTQTQNKTKPKPKPNQYIYELGNGIQVRRLVNLVLLTIGRSCVYQFARRGEHNHNNDGAYELYS